MRKTKQAVLYPDILIYLLLALSQHSFGLKLKEERIAESDSFKINRGVYPLLSLRGEGGGQLSTRLALIPFSPSLLHDTNNNADDTELLPR